MAGQRDTKTAVWPAAGSAVPGGGGEVTITRPALGETWHGTITSATADGMARVRIHSYTPRGGGPKRRMRHHVTVPLADLEHAPRRVVIRHAGTKTVTGRAWDESRHRRGRHGEFGAGSSGGFTPMHGFARLPWDQDGTTLRYHGSLGVDRGDMPQISGTVKGEYQSSAEMIPKFLDRLKARGITVTHERVPASSLKPTQTTGDAETVRRIADEIGRGQDTKPVLASSDSRVIDGHHQWAAHALTDSEGRHPGGAAAGVPVIRVHLPAREVLEQARQFAAGQGIGNRGTGVAANPEYTKTSGGTAVQTETKLFDEGRHPRDGRGHWIDVGHVVHLADGKIGKVTGVQSGGKVEVTLHGGGHETVDPKQINIHGPAGAAPPGARARPGFHGFTEGHAPLTDAAARSDTPKPLTDAEYDARTSHIETVLKGALDSGMATNHVHTLDPAGEVWTPARAAIHKEIVDKMLADAKDVPNEGKGVIAGGLGGAGKGTVLTKHAGIDTSKYMTINPDDVKEELARRGLIPKVEGLTPMEASALVHEESSRVANMAAQRAYEQKKNLIWDITMSSAKSADKRIGDMRKAGYGDLRGMFVDIPAETSVQRALGRHRRGLEDYRQGKGYGGRYVPPALIRKSAGTGPVSTNRQAFEQLHGKFDGWSMYDNSVNGRAPVHVASGGTAAAAAHPPWTVSGGTAHFHGSLGIDRGEMPQLSGTVNGEYVPASALVPKFMQQMQDRGVPVTHETVPATSLKPAQTSGDIETIQGIAASLRAGEAAKPAIVSSDDRVIDGHHTWAAGVTAGQDVPVIRVGLPAAQVISEMRAFNVAQGIAPRAAGVMANPEYARPAHIFPKDIKAGTKFIVNGVTYTAEADAVPIKNGRIYRVNGLTQDGRPQPINLRESDTVVATARPAEKKQAVRIKKISAA